MSAAVSYERVQVDTSAGDKITLPSAPPCLSSPDASCMNRIIHCTTISYKEIGRLVAAIGVWSIPHQD